MCVHLVDADPNLCDAMMELLKDRRYQAKSYETSEQFFETAEVIARDMILADENLPNQGIANIKSFVRQSPKHLKIIIMTGGDERARHYGFPQLKKPIDPHAFLRCLVEINRL